MPSFTPDTPVGNYKILGMSLTIPHVFAEGHTLTANEAKFVNRQLASVTVNGYGGDVRRALSKIDSAREKAFEDKTYSGPTTTVKIKGKDTQVPSPATYSDLTDWDHQSRLNEKFAEYELGVSNRGGAGGGGSDPLEALIERLATSMVKDLLKSKGRSIQKFMRTKDEEHGTAFKRLVSEYIDKRYDALVPLAEQEQARMQAEQAASADIDLGLDLEEDGDEEQAAA